MRGAAILGAFILGAMAATAMVCAYEDVQPGTPVDVEPTRSEAGVAAGKETAQSRWPPPQVQVTRQQAIETARDRCTGAAPEVTPVENPHDPVARLMPLDEFEDRTGGRSLFHGSDRYVWVVQFEGESLGAGLSARPGQDPPVQRFAGCAVDAEDGAVRQSFRGSAEPVLLPMGISPRIPSEVPDDNLGTAVEAWEPVPFTREEARNAVRSRYGSPGWFVDRVEIELVRYTGTCHGRASSQPRPLAVHRQRPLAACAMCLCPGSSAAWNGAQRTARTD